jgi:ubiquinone/menaquinone biosynthesis C-methylase UbiE
MSNEEMRGPGDPWGFMQEHDVQRFGGVIRDRGEQVRWSRAVFLGGLPYMWRKARPVLDKVYDRLELTPGDKVLVVGGSLESCGFLSDIRDRIGMDGLIKAIDICDEARDAYVAGRRGRNGMLATWKWNYTADIRDETFDCMAVLQGVQHTDDWTETGAELLRVMKPGRRLALAEIALGSPEFLMKIKLDLHIEHLFDKIFSRIGWDQRLPVLWPGRFGSGVPGTPR